MNPSAVEYGVRYSDNSGWEMRLSVDTQADAVDIDAQGTHVCITGAALWWIVQRALEARNALGMDKLAVDGPCPPAPTEPKI